MFCVEWAKCRWAKPLRSIPWKIRVRNGSALGKAFAKELGFDLDIDAIREPLEKIAAALNTGDFLDAAIRFSQLRYKDFVRRKNGSPCDRSECVSKANFKPAEARDERGRWSRAADKANGGEKKEITNETAIIDPICKMHKGRCIIEYSDTALPTSDYGVTFHRCLSKCMDALGCLRRA